ncbi:MAG: class I poly(R)-hydroxyalkanoic acid synthase [Sphingomonas sp.]|uniref:PHA/PHB synthase family protein n=1 Tax=Sphingomonas sp. TaxID=28214 RepID=UPI00122425D8|nr:class I poly(R)-hydroxyalkanoic acid synthase [Sphingomonas sp.]THD34529.1 MAG: class I poly(R)-hydroxyalkanoic acid synthase [Sphingomonas sp.]
MVDDPTPPEPDTTPGAGVRAVLDAWGQVLAPVAAAGRGAVDPKDRRFSGAEWEHPVFDLMRQGYSVMADAMMKSVDQAPGLDDAGRDRARFAMRTLVEAMSPANSPFTNPKALNKALDTGGASLAEGFAKMLRDFQRGQLTHTDPQAFEVGRNIATTPGKVVHETPLYQLIQYAPTTDRVANTPLVIFPPWINRFYILDLSPEKSFIRWAVDQGLTVFMVSWKSADASMRDVVWDDYIAAQIDAIDTIRDALDVKSVHAIGYCVAGTTLAATLAVLAAKGEAKKVKSATFFTAQIDFSETGELGNFIDDAYLQLIETLSGQGYLDGRYLAATFNMLRGKDLIWSPVVNHYLLGDKHPSFDLLHWNGDVTNLPAKWHKAYLTDLYRDNKLAQPGGVSALGVAIDLSKVETPSYIQAGREDHIAPAESVWKITHHFAGPLKFVLAGSGHIAGVVNPPAAGKYQYWTGDSEAGSLADFVAGATEHKGSWWPDWIEWIREFSTKQVAARVPGEGKLAAIEEAPGRYVKTR